MKLARNIKEDFNFMEKGREKTLTVLSLFSILFFSLIVQTAEGKRYIHE